MEMTGKKAVSMETILILILCFHTVDGSIFSSAKAEELYDNLTTGYYKDIRPCVGCGTPLVLDVTFHYTFLNYLDEVAGEMSSIAYFTIQWFDSRLAWNPLEYEGIVTMVMPTDKIWLPNLLLANPAKSVSTLQSAEFAQPRLVYNGLVIWTPGDIFKTRCNADISRYPFDEQECYLSFTPWGYLPEEIVFNLADNDNPFPFYVDNGMWILKNSRSLSYTQNSVNLVNFYYTFQRRSQFFIVNVLLPILVLGFINCLVFVIPTESGERIGYSMTVSLSFAVFLSLVGDNVPKTSEHMARLTYYLFSVFAMSAVIMIATIFNIRLYNRDPEIPIPDRYKTFVAILKYRSKRTSKVVPEHRADVNIVNPPVDEVKENDENCGHTVETSEKDTTWIEVSKCLDTVCAIVFFVIFIVNTVIQLVLIATS